MSTETRTENKRLLVAARHSRMSPTLSCPLIASDVNSRACRAFLRALVQILYFRLRYVAVAPPEKAERERPASRAGIDRSRSLQLVPLSYLCASILSCTLHIQLNMQSSVAQCDHDHVAEVSSNVPHTQSNEPKTSPFSSRL